MYCTAWGTHGRTSAYRSRPISRLVAIHSCIGYGDPRTPGQACLKEGQALPRAALNQPLCLSLKLLGSRVCWSRTDMATPNGDEVASHKPQIEHVNEKSAQSLDGKADSDQHAYPTEKGVGSVEYADGEAQSSDSDPDIVNHPAGKDDILRHTIHVEDDPTLKALTFRTWFVGMCNTFLPSQLFPDSPLLI